MSKPSTTRLPIQQNQAHFRELIDSALKHAEQLGASDAVAEVGESRGLSVSVRNRDTDTVEQNRDRTLGVTVYAGNRRGSASTSDFSLQAIRETVEAAWHIARYSAEDTAAALPAGAGLATAFHCLERLRPVG